ncbi:MAG: universal stress protein [Jatrophihabitantaceae bacterium]
MINNGRRIVLGISGHQTAHLIDWTTNLVNPADTVRIVHGYRPIPYAATDWQLPVDSDRLVRGATERHVRAAAARLRRFRPDVVVVEQLVGNPAAAALVEAAGEADLVLVGTPHCDRSRTVLAQLLAEVCCPVLVIGAGEPVGTGTVMAVLRGSQADETVLQAAFDQTRLHHRELLVLKPWQPPLDSDLFYAETAEQKMLDNYLASWRGRHPDVAVLAELRFGEPMRVLTEHAMTADLLVAGLPRPGVEQDYFEAMLDSVVTARDRPTLVVPELEPSRPLVTVGHPWAAEH